MATKQRRSQPSLRAPPSPSEMSAMCATYRERFGTVSAEEVQRAMSAEQHLPGGEANPVWLAYREGRVTGSRVGSIAGLTPPSWGGPDDTLLGMLWPRRIDNAACRWGNQHEDDAQDAFLMLWRRRVGQTDDLGRTLLSADVFNCGLVLDRRASWRAMSPDGLLRLRWRLADGSNVDETRLVEYKCPYRHREADLGPIVDYGMYPREPLPGDQGLSLRVPAHYYAQMTWGMIVLGDTMLSGSPLRAEFVVWAPPTGELCELRSDGRTRLVQTPKGTIEVTSLYFDPDFARELEATARRFWEQRYVPAAVLKAHGSLGEGDVCPPLHV